MPAINENLKLLRQANGLTQADVAYSISVTRQTVSSYETGRTQPDLETLKHLAEVFQADLHDVLYGGNRCQRRLKNIKLAVFILVAIMLLGILLHSTLFWAINKYFPVASHTAITADNRALIEMRLALRHIAETASAISAAIFSTGCIVMLYPVITVVHVITLRQLFLFFLLTGAAMFAFSLPFAIADQVFGLGDYLFPVWSGIIAMLLFFAVILAAKFIKGRRAK